MRKTILKYIFLFWLMGATYCAMEVIARGHTHWSMIVLAGIVGITVGRLNEKFPWEMDLLLQAIIGTVVALVWELVFGLIFNVWLGLNIWDYSNLPFNLWGQICPQFAILWFMLAFVIIFVDDIMRYQMFGEERPRYYICGKYFTLDSILY